MGRAHLLLVLSVSVTNIFCCEAAAQCTKGWNVLNASAPNGTTFTEACPYGYSIKGFDVTVPNNATWLERVCVIYGLLPYLIIGGAVLDAIGRGIKNRGIGSRSVIFLVFVGFQVFISEFILKKMVQQARPERSCNLTCGMPSSHSIMSVGFFVFMFLDAAYRVKPSYPLDVSSARRYTTALETQNLFCCGWSPREMILGLVHTGFNVAPVADSHTLSHYDFASMSLVWGVLLLPVPFTRTVLFDHSPLQVTAGSIIGFMEAVIFFAILRRLFTTQFNHLLGKRVGGIFIHNYGLSSSEEVSRCCILLAQAEDDWETGETNDEVMDELSQKYDELKWYLAQLDPCCASFTLDEEAWSREDQRNVITDMQRQIKAMVTKVDPEAGSKLIEEESSLACE